ncbi:hypothetical protein ABH912_005495 [Pseudomonas sp. BT76 TE3572]|uniref:Uncharacterized protein n=1 Tax=Pseudomonas mandelii PD30 TaxID=1419583 RepID=A0A059KZM6_9PSED|nr:hypothetical protein V466_18745 [Pseudomonas mandelii PD30]
MFPLIAAAVTRLPQVLKAADTAANVLQGASAASDLAKLKPPKPLDPTDVATAGGGDSKINY